MSDPLRDLDRALKALSGAVGRKYRKPHEIRHFNGISEHNGEDRHGTYQFRLRIPKGRAEYCCDSCEEDIPKGERHVTFTTTNQEGPGFECWRVHGECYFDGGPMFCADPRPGWRWAAGEARP